LAEENWSPKRITAAMASKGRVRSSARTASEAAVAEMSSSRPSRRPRMRSSPAPDQSATAGVAPRRSARNQFAEIPETQFQDPAMVPAAAPTSSRTTGIARRGARPPVKPQSVMSIPTQYDHSDEIHGPTQTDAPGKSYCLEPLLRFPVPIYLIPLALRVYIHHGPIFFNFNFFPLLNAHLHVVNRSLCCC
jgi:hypothetical protein